MARFGLKNPLLHITKTINNITKIIIVYKPLVKSPIEESNTATTVITLLPDGSQPDHVTTINCPPCHVVTSHLHSPLT